MNKTLSSIWFWWKKIGLIIGNIVSAVFLTVFYFTIFAPFAVIFRIFNREKKSADSNFIDKKLTISRMEEFKNEA